MVLKITHLYCKERKQQEQGKLFVPPEERIVGKGMELLASVFDIF